MTPSFDVNQLVECIEQVLDTGSEPHWARLAEILNASPEARRYYVRYMQLRSVLIQNGIAAISHRNVDALDTVVSELSTNSEIDLFETMIVPGISEEPIEANLHEEEIFQPAPLSDTFKAPEPSSMRRLAAVIAIALTAALVGGVIWLGRVGHPLVAVTPASSPSAEHPALATSTPTELPVARITRSVDAVWSPTSTELGSANSSGALLAGAHLSLAAGYVEIRFGKGATSIIEGPAEFSVESTNQLTLLRGRMSAKVPDSAHGFTVKTLQGTLTDLGTEFGAQSIPGGPTLFDVFKGSVQIAAGSNTAPAGQVFVAGQAVSVAAGKIDIDPQGAVAQRYVRDFITDKDRLDIVDLICGGDGTTKLAGDAIDACSGQIGQLPPSSEAASDGLYHRATRFSVVDGCCVPDGSKGPVQIDSLGHTFAFPKTTGHSFNHICTGGQVLWPAGVEPVSTSIDGTDYALDPHRVIIVHSNQALTLDLAAVRRLHPGEDVSRFVCNVANTYQHTISHFGLHVIVDGVARFQRSDLTHADGKLEVNIPIQPTDRFLTLATTDGDLSIWGDWAVWCDPQFVTTKKK